MHLPIITTIMIKLKKTVKCTPIVFLILLFLVGCKNGTKAETTISKNSSITIANAFIDAFYSFDSDSLQASLSQAKKSWPSILYYQKWAECGNYEVLQRFPCIQKNDSLVLCPVMVKDDLMQALELALNVTDTFHLIVEERKILSVETSSNDPDIYYEGKEWIRQNRPELIAKPCEGAWEGGPTPCECIKGTVQGLAAFKADQKS